MQNQVPRSRQLSGRPSGRLSEMCPRSFADIYGFLFLVLPPVFATC